MGTDEVGPGPTVIRSRRLSLSRVLSPLVTLFLVWAAFAGRLLVLSHPVAQPDAIVSLASHEWERLPAAAAAAARYPSARVLLTLPTAVSIDNCHDCANRVHRLKVMGVDSRRVEVLPLTIEGTRGEAAACRRFALSNGVTRLLVITSPYHARRSLAVFSKGFAGTNVQVGVEPASTYSQARPGLWWAARYDLWYVAYEWAALAYYGLAYDTWPGWFEPAQQTLGIAFDN